MSLKKTILVCISCFALNIVAQTIFTVNAGANQKICPGGQVIIGGHPTANGGQKPYTYAWTPTVSLNYPDSANPIASPTVTTTYTVSVRDGIGESKSAAVTVYIYPYSLSVSPVDTTIKEGQTITLHAHATGDSLVYWSSNGSMYNSNTLNPDAFPSSTATYSVIVVYPHGCTFYATLIVNVIPDNDLFFYNSFTPNGDGANDVFYVGNIGMYPNNTLDIYNRYGQKIYSVTGYNNDWDGKYLGTELPNGTYFYILDTHDKPGKYRGEVNLIR